MQDHSPDHTERINDFFSRHGGPGRPMQEGQDASGQNGWSEIYSGDGHVLRCDWTRVGTHQEMSYTERKP